MFVYRSYTPGDDTLKIGTRRLGDGFVSDASWPQGSIEAFQKHCPIPLPALADFKPSWPVNSPRLPFLHISSDVGDRADYMWTTIRTIFARRDSTTSLHEELSEFMDIWFRGLNLPDPIRHFLRGRSSAASGLPVWSLCDDLHYRSY